jgi:hypothetical protein
MWNQLSTLRGSQLRSAQLSQNQPGTREGRKEGSVRASARTVCLHTRRQICALHVHDKQAVRSARVLVHVLMRARSNRARVCVCVCVCVCVFVCTQVGSRT